MHAVARPQIEQRYTDAVQRVDNHSSKKRDFEQPENRMPERGERRVKRRRSRAQLADGLHVQQQVNQQQHAAHALDNVRQLASVLIAILHVFFLNCEGKSIARFSREMVSVRVIPLGQTAVQLN